MREMINLVEGTSPDDAVTEQDSVQPDTDEYRFLVRCVVTYGRETTEESRWSKAKTEKAAIADVKKQIVNTYPWTVKIRVVLVSSAAHVEANRLARGW